MSIEKELIQYFKSLGLSINTRTKARGHQGFFLKDRIDISKNTAEDRVVPTLLHEFAHYIHSKIEPDIAKTGGTLQAIFDTEDDLSTELLNVTNFVDESSKLLKLQEHKQIVKEKIKTLDAEIKADFPNFQRSKRFKEFEKATKKSPIRYLLKYDAVKVKTWIFGQDKTYSINNLETDFPELNTAFLNYVKLSNFQRKQQRISKKINTAKKYYSKPTELFARFVEGLYVNEQHVKTIAPNAFSRFFDLLEEGFYMELETVFNIIKNCNKDTPKS